MENLFIKSVQYIDLKGRLRRITKGKVFKSIKIQYGCFENNDQIVYIDDNGVEWVNFGRVAGVTYDND